MKCLHFLDITGATRDSLSPFSSNFTLEVMVFKFDFTLQFRLAVSLRDGILRFQGAKNPLNLSKSSGVQIANFAAPSNFVTFS